MSTLSYLLAPQNLQGFCLSILLGLLGQGGLFTWFTLYTTKLFGYRLAAKFIQSLLMSFAVGSLIIHAVWWLTDI